MKDQNSCWKQNGNRRVPLLAADESRPATKTYLPRQNYSGCILSHPQPNDFDIAFVAMRYGVDVHEARKLILDGSVKWQTR